MRKNEIPVYLLPVGISHYVEISTVLAHVPVEKVILASHPIVDLSVPSALNVQVMKPVLMKTVGIHVQALVASVLDVQYTITYPFATVRRGTLVIHLQSAISCHPSVRIFSSLTLQHAITNSSTYKTGIN